MFLATFHADTPSPMCRQARPGRHISLSSHPHDSLTRRSESLPASAILSIQINKFTRQHRLRPERRHLRGPLFVSETRSMSSKGHSTKPSRGSLLRRPSWTSLSMSASAVDCGESLPAVWTRSLPSVGLRVMTE